MLMALAGNTIFGFSFMFSKLALNAAEPPVLLAIRFLCAFAALNILWLTGIIRLDFKGKDLKDLFLLGLFQPVTYFICETYGIKYTSSSFAGILIALIPIAGIILAMLILKEKPTRAQLLFSVLSVAGVLVIGAGDKVGAASLKGVLFLLGAVFSGAMFSVQSSRLSDRFSAFERTYVMFAIGAVVFTAIALFRTWGQAELWITPITTGQFWISIAYLSCISSVGAFALLNKALDGLDVTHSLVFANVTTVVSVLTGVIVLHEVIAPLQIAGIIMVLLGVYGVNAE